MEFIRPTRLKNKTRLFSHLFSHICELFLNYFDKSKNFTRDFAQFVELYWYEKKCVSGPVKNKEGV